MEELLKMLEELLDKMYDIEDMNYKSDCYSSELSKDMKVIEEAINIIKNKWL